tara:strand:- start:52328 stop:52948 length:621 start_codon:yes stop_codon:yes gene_type:complete
MKPFFLLLLVFCLIQCKEETSVNSVIAEKDNIAMAHPQVIDSLVVLKEVLQLNQLKGIWYYNKKPFNGYAVTYYSNGIMEEKLGFFNGKREGVAQRWSENKVLRVVSNYNQNKLVGSYKTWWENGELAEESNYANGVVQGIQKQWYTNGQLAKMRNLDKGREDGMQQAWLKNGTCYVNYEAKNGRVFGLMRSNLCYQLEDEVVTRK